MNLSEIKQKAKAKAKVKAPIHATTSEKKRRKKFHMIKIEGERETRITSIRSMAANVF